MPEPIVPTESIEVLPSEENGNVPAEVPVTPPNPAPIEPAPAAVPAEPAAPPVDPELFELPDGRKVDAATLTKEWKENFLPDYTRKSQALAKVGETINPAPLQPTPTNPLEDPNWQPASYAELVQVAKDSALKEIADKEQAKANEFKAIEDAVTAQLTEVKTSDPTVNENALFLHATKYHFTDLRAAHQNMRDMAEMAKNVQQTTAKNVQKRNDPVSVLPGATGARPDPSNFENAREYLRSLKT